MADFTSAFWSWFIIIPVLAGIVGMFWLNRWMTERRRPGERPKLVGHVWDQDLKELNNPLPAWWLNLFYITLVFGIIYLLLYPGLGTFAGRDAGTRSERPQDRRAALR
jgi:cytochrome c oxidase cbb3-type subunit 3